MASDLFPDTLEALIARLKGIRCPTTHIAAERLATQAARIERLEPALALLQKWRALDAGDWHVLRHAREKEELQDETDALLAAIAPSSDSSTEGERAVRTFKQKAEDARAQALAAGRPDGFDGLDNEAPSDD